MVNRRRSETAGSRKTSKRHRWLAWTAGAAIVIVMGVFGLYRYYLNPQNFLLTPKILHHNETSGNPAFSHRITFLLMGSSLATVNHQVITNRKVRDRSDTIILVSLNPHTHIIDNFLELEHAKIRVIVHRNMKGVLNHLHHLVNSPEIGCLCDLG